MHLDLHPFGKPFDPAPVAPAVQASFEASKQAGLTLVVEGLNEWDLFRAETGMSAHGGVDDAAQPDLVVAAP